MIDSNAFIAYAHPRDENHARAKELLPAFFRQNPSVFTTDYVVVETVNFLLRKSTREVALETLNGFSASQKMKVLMNDRLSFQATREVVKQHPSLSFTDANLVYHLKRLGKKELLSFDNGFDGVPGVKRVH